MSHARQFHVVRYESIQVIAFIVLAAMLLSVELHAREVAVSGKLSEPEEYVRSVTTNDLALPTAAVRRGIVFTDRAGKTRVFIDVTKGQSIRVTETSGAAGTITITKEPPYVVICPIHKTCWQSSTNPKTGVYKCRGANENYLIATSETLAPLREETQLAAMKAALDSSQGVSVKSPISVGSHVTVGLTSGTTLDGKESKPRPLVDYKGRWMSPADMTNAMMAEKGLVLSDGQWISAKDNETNETKENTAKGLVEYKGKWMTPTDVSNAMNAATVEPQSPVSDTKPNEHARTEIQSDAAPEDRQAVLCAKCGTKCSLDAKFCTNCGVAMNAQTQTKNTPSSQSATFTGLLHYALVLVKIVKIGGAVAAIGVFIVVGWVVIRRTRWLHSASASEGNLEESSSALKGRFRSIAKGQRSIRTIVILGGAQLLVLLTMWNCSSRSIKVEHQQSTDFYAKQHAEHIGDISASAEGSRLIIAFKYSPEQKNPHFTNTRYILAYALFDENGARVAFGATTICFEPDIVESWSRGVRYNSELVKPGNNRIAVVVPKRDLREAAMVRIAIERDNR